MKFTDSSAASDFFGDDKWWPPGFRFHPTDEELVLYYLKRKICRRRIKLDIIAEIDVYKWDAEDLPEQSILKTGDRQWFFFSPRSRRYPSGERSNRATRHGYWKVTGKDRSVFSSSSAVGTKKTLVFYRGRAPSGQRTDWVMHEYTVDEEVLKSCRTELDYYALYKVFKKSGPGPKIGEQYGAPFKEDEWADDACLDVNKHAEAHKPLIMTKTATSDEDDLGVGTQPPLSPLNAIEGVVSYVADDSLGQIQINDRAHTTPQDGGNEETRSTMLEPEVTSAPNISGFEPGSIGGDFLEMDDLDGPHPAVPMPVDIHSFEDGMSEFDRCLDAAWFFQELDPMANQLDCLLPRMNDEGEANGLPCEGTFLQDPPLPSIGTSGLSADQNQGDADGWFTSRLWNFVDSIPSPPASASENAFMNRALGRMSSFSRLRPSPSNAAGNVNNHGDGGGRGLGFLLLSIVGAFCAVFWVFVMRGYLMSSLGRFVPL